MDKLLKLEKKQRKKEIKEQKKALKAQEKKERLELEEAYMQDRLVEKEIYKDINAAKRQAYIEEMKPIWEERKRKNEAPHLSILEEIGNAVSHGVGAILTVVALYSKVSGLVDVSNPTISTFRVSSSMSEDSEHFNPI